MRLFSIRSLLALPLALLLFACETPSPVQKLPQISFKDRPQIALDVSRVTVISEYQAPIKDPNVEHLFPTPPEHAVRRWAEDRLKSAGNGGKEARVIIQDASVIETQLSTDKGFKDAFKNEQAQRYDAKLSVAVQIRDDRGMPMAEVSARVSRSQSVGEKITLNEREKIWFEMTDSMMKDIDRELEAQIRQYMPAYIK